MGLAGGGDFFLGLGDLVGGFTAASPALPMPTGRKTRLAQRPRLNSAPSVPILAVTEMASPLAICTFSQSALKGFPSSKVSELTGQVKLPMVSSFRETEYWDWPSFSPTA